MESFTPLSAALGGSLIGLAAAVLWLGNGRLAGISGIFGQLLPPAQTVVWRLVFLVALVAGAWATSRLFPVLGVGGVEPAALVPPPAAWGVPPPVWLIVAGLLIGFGIPMAAFSFPAARREMVLRIGGWYAVNGQC